MQHNVKKGIQNYTQSFVFFYIKEVGLLVSLLLDSSMHFELFSLRSAVQLPELNLATACLVQNIIGKRCLCHIIFSCTETTTRPASFNANGNGKNTYTIAENETERLKMPMVSIVYLVRQQICLRAYNQLNQQLKSYACISQS